MDDLQIHIPVKPGKKKWSLFAWLHRKFIVEKMHNPLGIALFLLVGLFVSVGIARSGIAFGAGLIVSLTALPVVFAIIFYPVFGVVFTIIVSYLLFGVMRSGGIDFPLGTVMDGLEVLLMVGFFVKIKEKKDWGWLKNPVSYMILVWIGYNIIQVINPVASSKMAWLYTIRSVAIVMLTYFVFVYQLRSVGFVRIILKVWLVLSFIAALYAFKQELFGFSAGEMQWINSDPDLMDLLFIDGHWRKFSFFSDPVAFSYNMAVSSILCVCLISGNIKAWKKWVLAFATAVFLFAMLLSGTRGAFVLVPAALVLLAVLKFNKRVLIFSVIAGVIIAGLIFVPTSNPALYRFQSAFKPSEDASFLVRKYNQKRIQPYILTHPFGGGLGATGAWGQRFAPDSYLASFPPDSGYVRVAVELGWVGLLLFCTLMFVILRAGIRNYYRIRDPELKTYALAMILIVFALNIGNYPQEALVQFPNNLYFYLAAALISVLYQLDHTQKSKSVKE